MSLPDQTTDPRRSSSGERLARVAKDGQKGLFILLTLYLLLSLLSFHVSDPGWTHASSGAEVHNRGGRLGAWLADMILWLSGYPGYLSWLVLGWLGWSLCTSGYRPFSLMPGFSMRLFGLLLFYVGACSLGDAYFDASPLLPAGVRGGGVAGQVLGSNLLEILGLNGYTLLMLGLLRVILKSGVWHRAKKWRILLQRCAKATPDKTTTSRQAVRHEQEYSSPDDKSMYVRVQYIRDCQVAS